MWSMFVSFTPHLISLIITVAVGSATCYNKKKSDASTVSKSQTDPKSTTPKSAPKMGEGERTDTGATLGTDNPEMQAVLAEPAGDDVSRDYLPKLETILEVAANYMWGMKKHMAADEAAWKELAKRITLLQAEGYDVRAGTKEAKLRRLTSTNVTSLMDKVDKVTKKRKRKSSGAVGAD
ncbi:hypothetical protein RB195_000063 [Necator americanus]|uniref:MADF domain-containing protein n=1 Tax=Necator americanus TaxID=51031 RepID=A0ABR1D8E4_NECAM